MAVDERFMIGTAERAMNRTTTPRLNVYVYIEKNKTGGLFGIGKKSGENHGQLRVTSALPGNPSKLVLDIPTRSISIDLTNINLSEVTTQTYNGNEYVVINNPEYGSIHIRECNDMTYKIEGYHCHPELTLAMIREFLTRTQKLAANRPSIEQRVEANKIRNREGVDRVMREEETKMVAQDAEKIRMAELEGRVSALKRGGKKRRTRKHKGGKKHKKTQKGGKRGKRTQKGRGKRRATRKSHKKKH